MPPKKDCQGPRPFCQWDSEGTPHACKEEPEANNQADNQLVAAESGHNLAYHDKLYGNGRDSQGQEASPKSFFGCKVCALHVFIFRNSTFDDFAKSLILLFPCTILGFRKHMTKCQKLGLRPSNSLTFFTSGDF